MVDFEAEIPERIESACQEYADPDSDMTVEELEDEIERAFMMEYEYEELLGKMDALMSHKPYAAPMDGQMMFYGHEIDPGESIQFADDFGIPDPHDYRIDPWDDDDGRDAPDGWCAWFKDCF
jgi:hypothetical protein